MTTIDLANATGAGFFTLKSDGKAKFNADTSANA